MILLDDGEQGKCSQEEIADEEEDDSALLELLASGSAGWIVVVLLRPRNDAEYQADQQRNADNSDLT